MTSSTDQRRISGDTIRRVRNLLPPGTPVSHAVEAGTALRSGCPRSSHRELDPPADRDPLAVIERTESGRLPDLLGVRAERMSESEFAYFRGTADVMAADLAAGPSTGIELVICGDAHVGNFGLYATPERRLVFDLNDFDEAWVGPWEWDVKRLAVSVDLVLREKAVDAAARAEAVASVVGVYRDALHLRVRESSLDRYFSSVDADWLLDAATTGETESIERSLRRARRRTSEQVLTKIATEGPEGDHRIVHDPPVLVPLERDTLEEIRERFAEYLTTLRPDRALLISQFRVVHAARRVVGVGSVGTRCAIVLLEGPTGAPLILQIKEAGRSVLADPGHIGVPQVDGGPIDAVEDGYRVVTCQQILQSASDPFLGWSSSSAGHNYYWRQFRDMKGDLDLDRMKARGVVRYGRLCAALLARAHSQSPNSAAVAGYLGRGDVFPEAIAAWAGDYSDVVAADHRAYLAAVAAGRFVVDNGKAGNGQGGNGQGDDDVGGRL